MKSSLRTFTLGVSSDMLITASSGTGVRKRESNDADVRYCSGAPDICADTFVPGRPSDSNVSFPALKITLPSLHDHASGRDVPVLATWASLSDFLKKIGGENYGKNTPGKTRLLTIRAERLVYLSERGARCIIICLEFTERRLEFVVRREDDVDLTLAQLRRE